MVVVVDGKLYREQHVRGDTGNASAWSLLQMRPRAKSDIHAPGLVNGRNWWINVLEMNTKNQRGFMCTILLRRNKLETGGDFRLCPHKICEVRNHQRVLEFMCKKPTTSKVVALNFYLQRRCKASLVKSLR